MFAEDPDDPVNSIEFTFLHRKHDGFWDWPRKPDMKQVSSKFVFYGPCLPSAPTKKGFQRHITDIADLNNIYSDYYFISIKDIALRIA